MKPWVNYHHLLYFKTIASEGGIARAADKLRLGQPTLSAQLKQFEDTIGVKLFERQHKKMVLTEAGRVALKYADEIFRMGDEMIEVLHDRLTPARIHVQIAALDSVPKHLILAVGCSVENLPARHSSVVGCRNTMIRNGNPKDSAGGSRERSSGQGSTSISSGSIGT